MVLHWPNKARFIGDYKLHVQKLNKIYLVHKLFTGLVLHFLVCFKCCLDVFPHKSQRVASNSNKFSVLS